MIVMARNLIQAVDTELIIALLRITAKKPSNQNNYGKLWVTPKKRNKRNRTDSGRCINIFFFTVLDANE